MKCKFNTDFYLSVFICTLNDSTQLAPYNKINLVRDLLHKGIRHFVQVLKGEIPHTWIKISGHLKLISIEVCYRARPCQLILENAFAVPSIWDNLVV